MMAFAQGYVFGKHAPEILQKLQTGPQPIYMQEASFVAALELES